MLITLNEQQIEITTNSEFVALIKQHPKQHKSLFSALYSANTAEFAALFPDNFEILKTANLLGAYSDELFQLIFAHPQKFSCLIKDEMDLRLTAQLYPQYEDKLFELVLLSSQEFNRVFPQKTALQSLGNDFSEYKYLLAIYHFIYQHDLSLMLDYVIADKKPHLLLQIKNVVKKSIEHQRICSNTLATLAAIISNEQKKAKLPTELTALLTKLQEFLFHESKTLSLLEYGFAKLNQTLEFVGAT